MERGREEKLAEWRKAEALRDKLEEQYQQRPTAQRARRQGKHFTSSQAPARSTVTVELPDVPAKP